MIKHAPNKDMAKDLYPDFFPSASINKWQEKAKSRLLKKINLFDKQDQFNYSYKVCMY